MAIRGGYAPPGVYTETVFDSPTPGVTVTGNIPLLIGKGIEVTEQKAVTMVRGSSSVLDNQVVGEDPAGRAVSGFDPQGFPILTDFDGIITKVQVQHYPIVTGDGIGRPSTNPSDVQATINGNTVLCLSIDSAKGVVGLSEAPQEGDIVRLNYYFKRTDTKVTDEDVSAQVSPDFTYLYAGEGNFVWTNTTNKLIVVVDGTTYTATISAPGVNADRLTTLERVVNTINGLNLGSLTASKYTTNIGVDNLLLKANGSISIGSGSINSALGLALGQTGSTRTTTFYTSNAPIVDGSNGGRVTTTVTDITVKVNGVKVTPVSVDGQSGAFTLKQAPVIGSTVTVTYYFNTFRDQFDFIPARDVTAVTRNSLVPAGGGASSQFIQGADWVLHNDTIVWGSSALATPKLTNGVVEFGEDQISLTLRDERAFLMPCTTVAGNAFAVKLPYQPVDGTGLGIPTSNKALVSVKVGYGLADALEKSDSIITRIDPATSTVYLQSAVPVGATAFATFYYNTLVDNAEDAGTAFYLTVNSAGVSNVGTYNVAHNGGIVYGLSLTAKGTALANFDINFPTGSSLFPDIRFEGGTPVEEEITVQFTSSLDNNATYTSKGMNKFYFAPGYSDTFDFVMSSNDVSVNLNYPSDGANITTGITAVVGDPARYLATTGFTALADIADADTLELKIDGKVLNVLFNAIASPTLADVQSVLNGSGGIGQGAVYTAMSSMNGNIIIVAGKQDKLSFSYTGDDSGQDPDIYTITIPAGSYNAEELAGALNDEFLNNLAPNAAPFSVQFGTDQSNRITAELTGLTAGDNFGYLEFISQGSDDEDFAIIAGIDTDLAPNGFQTKFGILPVMDIVSYNVSGGTGFERKERAVLRNSIVLGTFYNPPSTTSYGVEVVEGTILSNCGFIAGSTPAFRSAVMQHATLNLKSNTAWSSQTDSQPTMKFYDGTGATAANNVLSLDINGTQVTITFDASENGTEIPVGPFSDITSVISVISTACIDAGLLLDIRQSGYEISLAIQGVFTSDEYIKVLSGSANKSFGLRDNQTVSSAGVAVNQVVSAFYNTQQAEADLALLLFLTDSVAAGTFMEYAVAYETVDSTGGKHLSFDTLNMGLGSTLKFAGGNAITTVGTGVLIPVDTEVEGEDGLNGFYVTSNNANGSGSANSSILNSGVGQDGFIGQTYTDTVTGLTFTILPLDGGQAYPTGAGATLTFTSTSTIKTNANIPRLIVPGVQMIVANTSDLVVGDQAIVQTYDKSGAEPNIGEVYYIDIVKQKTNLNTTIIFNTINDVIAEFGEINSQNTLSLGAYFAFLNGSSSVACRQLPVLDGEADITQGQVIDALEDIEGAISSNIFPNVIVPMIPASDLLLAAISRHCDVQSSIRYRAERTAILGCAAGTQPQEAARLATVAGSARVRLLYPDIVSATVTDTLGRSTNLLLDGRYLAIALASATTNAGIDAATPWDRRPIVGFTNLARTLDAVQANQTAQNGVTILEQNGLTIRVRHGLTTDMSSILTRTPTVTQIADEVHRRARDLFDSYIGLKFLPSIISQIEGRANAMFKDLVAQKIIDSYTGLSVTIDPNDPTGLLVEVYYKPVFPLLYIQFTFNVRSSI